MTAPDPQHTYALVVSVSECDLGQDWARPGLEENAADFTAWLHARGVPDSNIERYTQNFGKRATAQHVHSLLSRLPLPWPPDAYFWLYWAGHGVVDGKRDIRLITADATRSDVRNFSLHQILELLSDENTRGPRHQTVVVDACLTNADDVDVERLSHPVGLPAASSPARGLRQETWIATGLGEPARSTREKGGLFSAAVLQSLQDGGGLDWQPTADELTRLIKAKAPEFRLPGDVTQRPIRLLHENDRGNAVDCTIDLGTDRPPPVPSLLRAWHLPPDWRRGDSRPAPGDAYPARLDVLWSLDRGPLRGVLADSPGIDLADVLQSVEFHVLRDWTSEEAPTDPGRPGGPPRLWCTIPDTGAAEQPPATPAALSHLVTPLPGLLTELAARPAGSGLGLVVRCDDGGPRFAAPAIAVSYAAGLARSWPQAAVVFHVTAEFPARAMRVAAEIGQWLSRHDPGLRATVVTRVLPGAGDAPSADLLTTKQAILDRILMSSNPVARSSEVDDFVTRIDALAEHGTPLAQLAEAFREVRDLDDRSGEYIAALRAHASRGADPTRYASLAAAAARDDDLAAWLSAAAEVGRPPVPGVLPAGLMSQESLDSVVLTLLRRAEVPAAAQDAAVRWRLLISSRAQQAADYLGSPSRARLTPDARAAADREFLLSCPDLHSAQAALRAGIGRALMLRDLCPDDRPSPAAWVMLTHRPLDQTMIPLIADWPLDLRRVLGFTAGGEERVERSAETLERLTSAYLLLRPVFPAEIQLNFSFSGGVADAR